MKKKKSGLWYRILFPTIVLCILLYFLTAVSNLDQGMAQEDKKQLENALTRAAVSCYAIEGSYPPSAEYLVENYRISYDMERYVIKYELYASNLMPSITVLERDYEN